MIINNLLIYLFEDVNMKNTLKLMHIIDHINKKEEKSNSHAKGVGSYIWVCLLPRLPASWIKQGFLSNQEKKEVMSKWR